MCEENKKQFVNPYHFFPLAKECKRKQLKSYEEEELVTGKIKVKIVTETPLFIPNIMSKQLLMCDEEENSQEPKHPKYEFFSYNAYLADADFDNGYEPIIPGSEIRGMIRNVYETVTGSCMSSVELDKPLYKRITEAFKCGILEKRGKKYKLYNVSFNNIAYIEAGKEKPKVPGYVDGDKVWVKTQKKEKNKKNIVTKIKSENSNMETGWQEGYLLIGEQGPDLKESKTRKRKHYAKVLLTEKLKEECEIKDATITAFENVLETYGNEKINKNIKSGHSGYSEYKKKWEEFNKSEDARIPVYYSIVTAQKEKKIYLSPACITKESYYNKLADLFARNTENLAPCCKVDHICPACALFGMIGEKSVASKIRFADAHIDSKNADTINYNDFVKEYMKWVTLEELAQPRITATEMYLRKPEDNAAFWTYDYYVKNNRLEEYTDKVPLEIMGRKFYWHHQFEDKKQPPKTERNKTVRLLTPGVSFQTDVYFDNITRKQLDQLIYLLNISSKRNEEGHKQCYKLGTGKPLGLGSVSLQVLNVTERKFDITSEEIYQEREYQPKEKSYEQVGFAPDMKVPFKWAIDFNILDGNTVSYPLTEQQYLEWYENNGSEKQPMQEGFKWFTENKVVIGDNGKVAKGIKKRTQMQLRDYLKPLDSIEKIDDIEMMCRKESEKEEQ